MSEQDERTEAEGGEEQSDSKDKLPFLPSKDDDTPLGDTDQHSDAPTPPRTGR